MAAALSHHYPTLPSIHTKPPKGQYQPMIFQDFLPGNTLLPWLRMPLTRLGPPCNSLWHFFFLSHRLQSGAPRQNNISQNDTYTPLSTSKYYYTECSNRSSTVSYTRWESGATLIKPKIIRKWIKTNTTAKANINTHNTLQNIHNK